MHQSHPTLAITVKFTKSIFYNFGVEVRTRTKLKRPPGLELITSKMFCQRLSLRNNNSVGKENLKRILLFEDETRLRKNEKRREKKERKKIKRKEGTVKTVRTRRIERNECEREREREREKRREEKRKK